MTSSEPNLTPAGLVATDLACRRGEREVFRGLSFNLPPGTALILRGRNGSGKSSLLRLIAGLLAPASGELTWDGVAIGADPAVHAARLTFVGHLDPIKAALTVAENLETLNGLTGETANIDDALNHFGLLAQKDLPARFLSAGQRRRANLSRLLAPNRPLWLLDEPTVALDTASSAQLISALERHLDDGGMAIVATHDDLPLSDAETLELSA